MIDPERRRVIDQMLRTFVEQERPYTVERYPQRMCAMLAGVCQTILEEIDELRLAPPAAGLPPPPAESPTPTYPRRWLDNQDDTQ